GGAAGVAVAADSSDSDNLGRGSLESMGESLSPDYLGPPFAAGPRLHDPGGRRFASSGFPAHDCFGTGCFTNSNDRFAGACAVEPWCGRYQSRLRVSFALQSLGEVRAAHEALHVPKDVTSRSSLLSGEINLAHDFLGLPFVEGFG